MSDLALLVSSRRFRLVWVIPTGLLIAAFLGLAVSRYGLPAFALVTGPALALLIAIRPELGIYAITLSLPIEDLIPGIGSATGTRLIGIGVFGVWALRKIILRESWLLLIKSPVVLGALAFSVWAFVSTLWAENQTAAIVGLVSQVQLLALALIVIDLMQTYKHVVWIVRLLILGGLIAAGSTIQQYYVGGAIRAGDGVSGGINFTASFLVSILPFAFYIVRSRSTLLWAVLGMLYIPLSIIAVTVTFSRTSYIMLVFVLVIHAWIILRTRFGGIWILLLGGLTAAGLFFAPQEAINDRVQTITPLVTNWISPSPNASQQADSRAFHWKVGFEMFKDSPLLGIGFNNFGVRFLEYQFEVQGMPEVFANPRSSHSSYIGIMVDIGIVGVAIFLFILYAVIRILIQAIQRLKTEQDHDHLILVQAVLYVFTLQVLYGWALNTHLNKNFWLILGLSVVLNRLSKKPENETIGGNDVRRS